MNWIKSQILNKITDIVRRKENLILEECVWLPWWSTEFGRVLGLVWTTKKQNIVVTGMNMTSSVWNKAHWYKNKTIFLSEPRLSNCLDQIDLQNSEVSFRVRTNLQHLKISKQLL